MNLLQLGGRTTSGLLGRESSMIRRLRPAYETLLDWTSLGKGIPWTINGVTYRVDPRYRRQLGQNYDVPVAAFLRDRVRPGAICFNVGANGECMFYSLHTGSVRWVESSRSNQTLPRGPS